MSARLWRWLLIHGTPRGRRALHRTKATNLARARRQQYREDYWTRHHP